MDQSANSGEKPGLFNAIVAMTLASGLVNLFWGFAASAAVVSTVIGIICAPITILPTVLGTFEVIYAARLLSAPHQPVRPSPAIAALEIACLVTGNVFSMVVGILSLVFYHDTTVKSYFARLQGLPLPVGPVFEEPGRDPSSAPTDPKPEKSDPREAA
jgi:hypothetical protein